ncbi:hypothetical protein [Saccharopolyspora shandongensis]|uniref:hypothetical protein n=1 Tax=Saccharopolyspora shandongensis TaxID=418495 RepID=UPI003F4D7D14
MLPQVVVLIAGGALIGPLITRVGLTTAAGLSAGAVVCGLAVYTALGRFGYVWIAVALVLVAMGMRVVGVVAGNNVMRGLPENSTTIGAALIDTASEVTIGIGIALSGTILAVLFPDALTAATWSAQQTVEFREAIACAGLALPLLSAALVGWGIVRGPRPKNNMPKR